MAITLDTIFMGWMMMALCAGMALTICLSAICSLCDLCCGPRSRQRAAQDLLLRIPSIEEPQEIPLEAYLIRAA